MHATPSRFRPRLLVAGLALWWAACASPPSDVVRIGVDVDAATLDPRLARDTTAYRACDLMFDGLVRLDGSLRPLPALAERWETPTPTTWIFHLRDGVRFHDGRPLSADDVAYTFQSILDPELRAPLRSLYTPIAEVAAIDSRTVRLTLENPYAPLLSYLDMGIVPQDRAEGGPPVGTGPYRIEGWESGSKIRLARNPDYWGGAPEIERLELVIVPDNTARAQAFEAGDLDLIQSPLSPRDVARLTAEAGFRAVRARAPALTYLNFNTDRPLLADARMRRAVSMLVDQDTILNQIYEGTDERASSVLLPSWWAFSEDVEQPSYAPARAVALLEQMGWVDSDGDGVRDRGGEPLRLELGTHSEDVNRIQTVEFLQHAFSQSGIECSVRISDWASFSARRDAGDYDIILLGWTQLVDPDRLLFDQLRSDGGLNWGGFADSRLDELLLAGRRTASLETRAGIYRQAAGIVAREVPYYVLSHQSYQLFASQRLDGFVPDPRGLLRGLTRARLDRGD